MLRKMSRSFKKDQRQTSQETLLDSGSNSRFYCFNVPRLFLGSSPKGLSDSDSIKSPTSPLDHVFSYLDHTLRLPPSPGTENRKSWDCGKVGLGIIDFVGEDTKESEKIFPPSETNNILFGPQIRTHSPKPISSFRAPNSSPKSYSIFSQALVESPLQPADSDVLFEIGEAALESEQFRKFRACSLDSSISFSAPSASDSSTKCAACASIGSLSTAQIELSEDYTRVVSHGSNPQTTHIYGDCILECQSNDYSHFGKKWEEITPPISTQFPSSEFLSFCYWCSKTLKEGKDIYMYRGEKAFCSLDCRSTEIMIEEETEKSKNMARGNCMDPEKSEELSEPGIAVAV